jgi:hypothetical protein
MPLDGTVEATILARLEQENPQLTLKQAMFEVRPPVTKVAGRLATRPANGMLLPVSRVGLPEIKVFTKPITKSEVIALVRLCSDSKRLMAQNAALVPYGNRYREREYCVDDIWYYSPHGFIDYYVTEALGGYYRCEKVLEQNALVYLGFLEKQHRAIHRLRRNAFEQEREFEVLLEAA